MKRIRVGGAMVEFIGVELREEPNKYGDYELVAPPTGAFSIRTHWDAKSEQGLLHVGALTWDDELEETESVFCAEFTRLTEDIQEVNGDVTIDGDLITFGAGAVTNVHLSWFKDDTSEPSVDFDVIIVE